MPTTAADVVEIVSALAAVGVGARLGGGWGIDALVGRQTREHRDLDLAIDAEQLAAAEAALGALGFTVSTDWLPVRMELSQGGRHIDVHPLNYQPDGSAWQAGLEGTRFDYPADAWARGTVGGATVVCLSAARQRLFHSGYPPRQIDLHDLALLDEVELRARRAGPHGSP
jgi:lincosamide nucleotidyltransferase A/C/D/E